MNIKKDEVKNSIKKLKQTKVSTFYFQKLTGEASTLTVNKNLINLYNEFLPHCEKENSIKNLIRDFKHKDLNSLMIEEIIFDVILSEIKSSKKEVGLDYEF